MKATLLTWTVLRAPPPGFDKDRVVGLVEFEDGRRAFVGAPSEVGLRIGVAVDVVAGSLVVS